MTTLARALAHLPSVVNDRDRPVSGFATVPDLCARYTAHMIDDAVMSAIAHPHQGQTIAWRFTPQRRREHLAGFGLSFWERQEAGL